RTSAGEYQRCGLPPSARPTSPPTSRTVRPGAGLAASILAAHESYPMPFSIKTPAPATTRASVGLGSYACGSVAGLVMIDVSWTRAPPSCAAMLPHAFIVATTVMGLPPALAPTAADVVGLEVEHAAIMAVANSATGARAARRPVCRLRTSGGTGWLTRPSSLVGVIVVSSRLAGMTTSPGRGFAR